MKLTIANQPFAPSGARSSFGGQLISALTNETYQKVRLCAAFASLSGTSQIIEPLDSAIQRGASVQAMVGIGNGVTTVQAVEHLSSVGVEVVGCKVSNVLYHPKIYLLTGENAAWVGLGSSNLTGNGLFRNVEANFVAYAQDSDEKDKLFIQRIEEWLDRIEDGCGSVLPSAPELLSELVEAGDLVDETKSKTRISSSKKGKRSVTPPPFDIPSLPLPAVYDGAFSKSPTPGKKVQVEGEQPVGDGESVGTQFAMVLSAFDCSHKSGVKGTPEISIPESVTSFFPEVELQGRKYPDAYFEALVNTPGGAVAANYRIWQRPPGSEAGHADWRINIGHVTTDLTTDGGGDIILFERSQSEDSETQYEVWIVRPDDSRYADLQQRCSETVSTTGAAGQKSYGIF